MYGLYVGGGCENSGKLNKICTKKDEKKNNRGEISSRSKFAVPVWMSFLYILQINLSV